MKNTPQTFKLALATSLALSLAACQEKHPPEPDTNPQIQALTHEFSACIAKELATPNHTNNFCQHTVSQFGHQQIVCSLDWDISGRVEIDPSGSIETRIAKGPEYLPISPHEKELVRDQTNSGLPQDQLLMDHGRHITYTTANRYTIPPITRINISLNNGTIERTYTVPTNPEDKSQAQDLLNFGRQRFIEYLCTEPIYAQVVKEFNYCVTNILQADQHIHQQLHNCTVKSDRGEISCQNGPIKFSIRRPLSSYQDSPYEAPSYTNEVYNTDPNGIDFTSYVDNNGDGLTEEISLFLRQPTSLTRETWISSDLINGTQEKTIFPKVGQNAVLLTSDLTDEELDKLTKEGEIMQEQITKFVKDNCQNQ